MLSALVGYLLEPAEENLIQPALEHSSLAGPVVAVVGTRAGCGTTTVARALAVELARRHPEGACAVAVGNVTAGGVALGSAATGRLARGLAMRVPGEVRVVGRTCLVDAELVPLVDAARDLAPLVIDVEAPEEAQVAASLADAVVLVATPEVEPALADLLAASLANVGPEPVVVLNRSGANAGRWEGRCDVALPESRIGARLALAGREAHGPLGAAVGGLTALLEERR